MKRQLLHFGVGVCLCANACCLASGWRLQLDAQGDAHHSRYNFTDLKKPYDGIDAWGELKLALWPEPGRQISPYISSVPVTTTESEFWWQRNITNAIGIQLYPMDILHPPPEGGKDEYDWSRSLRLYSTYGVREYYDKPRNTDPEDEDVRFGFDYYNDNLFDKNALTYLLWTNLTHRSTNYTLSEYNAVLWEGNAKLGAKFWLNIDESSIVLPYGVVDWTYVPDHGARWWENFVRAGVGIRLYPKVSGFENKQLGRILERFNIYAEVFRNVSWLGDDAPSSVKETDWRIGLNFSTFWERWANSRP